jgi:hypothetical protein
MALLPAGNWQQERRTFALLHTLLFINNTQNGSIMKQTAFEEKRTEIMQHV